MCVDEQTVSGLFEVPASVSTEGARKKKGRGIYDSQEKDSGQNQLNDIKDIWCDSSSLILLSVLSHDMT